MRMYLLFIMFISTNIMANILQQEPNGNFSLLRSKFKIESIIQDYAKIKDLNLIMNKEIKGTFSLYGIKEIKKEDLDLYISAVANSAGYTLMINDQVKQVEVIYTRDVRYKGGIVYKEINKVPKTYNYVQFIMNLKHAPAREISRNMRPFMSRYGRVIAERNSNTLIISDTAKNIRRLYKLIKKLDTQEFVNDKKYIDNLNSKAVIKTEVQVSTLDFIKDQHILFLIVFSLMGGILGFGIRGYMMKKMEGGW